MTSGRSASIASQPEHEFEYLRDELTTPMRDGTRLKADLYLPKGPGPWPALITTATASANTSSPATRRRVRRASAGGAWGR